LNAWQQLEQVVIRDGEQIMNREIKIIKNCMLALIISMLLIACGSRSQNVIASGTGWGTGVFSTNGERIYFTSTSERGQPITYTNGPSSNSWMMGGGGYLACASCHGPDGHGGVHNMGMMQTMDAKDIRWSTLAPEFDAEKFRQAIVEGKDPDGTQLSTNMPRWNIGNDDLADLIDFLKTLP
jgi:hypothetical protein